MRIFRIEHRETCIGPWLAGYSKVTSCLSHCYNSEFPGIFDDAPGESEFTCTWAGMPWSERDRHYCGLTSEFEVVRWFAPAFSAMVECNFVLRVFDVPDEDVIIGKSRTQVFFKRGRQVMVEEREINTLIEDAA